MAPLVRMASGRQKPTRFHQPAPRAGSGRPSRASMPSHTRAGARTGSTACAIGTRRASHSATARASAASSRIQRRMRVARAAAQRAERVLGGQALAQLGLVMAVQDRLFSFSRPRRTQVFTVPSGSRMWLASSECDRPSKNASTIAWRCAPRARAGSGPARAHRPRARAGRAARALSLSAALGEGVVLVGDLRAAAGAASRGSGCARCWSSRSSARSSRPRSCRRVVPDADVALLQHFLGPVLTPQYT